MASRPLGEPGKYGSNKKNQNYGQGQHRIDVSEFEMADPDDLKEKLLSIFKSPHYKAPVLPGLALELTELTRKVNVSYDDVIKVLERDPILVAEVLKIASSPLYSTRGSAVSLKDAVSRLGINTLRDIVWQVVANMRLFRVKGYTNAMQRLQGHSLFTAYAARLVATHAGVAGEHAFLCGLLHDIGISGTLIALSEGSSGKEPPRLSLLWPAVDKMHAEAAGMMGRLWGLSPEVCSVIGKHHALDPHVEPVSPLVPVLCVAEKLANDCNWGIMPKQAAAIQGDVVDQYLPGRYEYALQRLNLTAKQKALAAACEQMVAKLGLQAS